MNHPVQAQLATPVRTSSQRFAARLARPLAIMAILAGCTPGPASESPGPKTTTKTADNRQPAAAPGPNAPTAELVAAEPTPSAEAAPAAQPLANSPIEDPPVIGTPQEVFNFPRPPLEMPKVLLTDAERAASPVGVGSVLPEIELSDIQGAKKQLSSLYGKKLTVIVFWNSRNPYAVEELGDLGPLVVDRFGPHGVSVVGINERDGTDVADKAINSAGAKFPILLDSDGQAFAKLATGELPRTYLVDASGKVLWFDLEYSRSTRRDLKQAIQYTLLRK